MRLPVVLWVVLAVIVIVAGVEALAALFPTSMMQP